MVSVKMSPFKFDRKEKILKKEFNFYSIATPCL